MKKISYNPLWKTLIDKGIKNKRRADACDRMFYE